jgi:hypothetical protein
MGVKARTVVRVLVSRGMERVFPASRAASRGSAPISMRVRMSSATTMPLSTSMPRAMIMEAMDMRCSSIPMAPMTTRPSSITRGTKEPTIMPVRSPRKSMTTTRTMTRVSTTLMTAPFTAFLMRSGW